MAQAQARSRAVAQATCPVMAQATISNRGSGNDPGRGSDDEPSGQGEESLPQRGHLRAAVLVPCGTFRRGPRSATCCRMPQTIAEESKRLRNRLRGLAPRGSVVRHLCGLCACARDLRWRRGRRGAPVRHRGGRRASAEQRLHAGDLALGALVLVERHVLLDHLSGGGRRALHGREAELELRLHREDLPERRRPVVEPVPQALRAPPVAPARPSPARPPAPGAAAPEPRRQPRASRADRAPAAPSPRSARAPRASCGPSSRRHRCSWRAPRGGGGTSRPTWSPSTRAAAAPGA